MMSVWILSKGSIKLTSTWKKLVGGVSVSVRKPEAIDLSGLKDSTRNGVSVVFNNVEKVMGKHTKSSFEWDGDYNCPRNREDRYKD